ncbi:hypothetical protein C2845_PMPSC055349 [Panicum miliaceum]|uniref:Uncharacterized protein n=1 Tax=Panicum miliaceum TaxID=4540 RepID=A0A3L6PCS3_PANMI|nr:hypothetical protein C2845_PMPSC055349 [Panicum miliaceum]
MASGKGSARPRMRARASGRPPTAAACATWETSSGHTAILRSEMDLKKTKIFTLSGDRPECSDTVARFAKNMQDLQRKVGTMILKSLGVQRSTSSALFYNVRLVHYGSLSETGTTTGLSMQPHRDCMGRSYTYSSMSVDDFV